MRTKLYYENRIKTLEGRGKDNYKIIKKLRRKLKALRGE